MYVDRHDSVVAAPEAGSGRGQAWRIVVFLSVLVVVAGGGLAYDYSRPGLYRATARLLVEPPGNVEDPAAKARFALSEAQALRRSDLVHGIAQRLEAQGVSGADGAADLEQRLTAEAVPDTAVIELRAEGYDRTGLVAALSAWIELYVASRTDTDRTDRHEALEDAQHAVQVARSAVEAKRRELEAFRRLHGIVSIERDENPAAARLKGLNSALNDAAAREVNAESRLRALNESLAQGQGVIRAVDKPAIANLELRAADLREKMKGMEMEYTAQYLALDPKFKALQANLARMEQQIGEARARSHEAALGEARAEYASAQRATQQIREQTEGLKQQTQVFSMRFAELRRMAGELEQLEDSRNVALDRLRKLESERKPSQVRINVLSKPIAGQHPISPDYSRDAAFALGGGFVIAIAAVWLMDFLRRESPNGERSVSQPIIQIAYPVLGHQQGAPGARLPGTSPVLLASASAPAHERELAPGDVGSLWASAPPEGRLIIAALFAGLAPEELNRVRRSDVDFHHGRIAIAGSNARVLELVEPLRGELLARAEQAREFVSDQLALFANGTKEAPDPVEADALMLRCAHDAGLRHPELVTSRALRFTYAAFLARQGIRMAELMRIFGPLNPVMESELMRLAPSGRALDADRVERVYPCFREA